MWFPCEHAPCTQWHTAGWLAGCVASSHSHIPHEALSEARLARESAQSPWEVTGRLGCPPGTHRLAQASGQAKGFLPPALQPRTGGGAGMGPGFLARRAAHPRGRGPFPRLPLPRGGRQTRFFHRKRLAGGAGCVTGKNRTSLPTRQPAGQDANGRLISGLTDGHTQVRQGPAGQHLRPGTPGGGLGRLQGGRLSPGRAWLCGSQAAWKQQGWGRKSGQVRWARDCAAPAAPDVGTRCPLLPASG